MKDLRKIKVCGKWQGNKTVPSIQIQGIYLQEYDFQIGDTIRVELYRDEIRIKRMNSQDILNNMMTENPSLGKLINQFGCEVCQ